MLYSVYRPELKAYDYYQTAATLDDARNPLADNVNERFARPGKDGEDLGVASEHAGYLLPHDAQKIGQGAPPRGMIATIKPSGTGLGDTPVVIGTMSTFTKMALLAGGLGLFFWHRK